MPQLPRSRANTAAAGSIPFIYSSPDQSAPEISQVAALFDAIWLLDVDRAQQLLHAGADATAAGPHGQTALFTAAQSGNAQLVKLLLDNNANVSAVNELGQNAGQNALTAAVLGPSASHSAAALANMEQIADLLLLLAEANVTAEALAAAAELAAAFHEQQQEADTLPQAGGPAAAEALSPAVAQTAQQALSSSCLMQALVCQCPAPRGPLHYMQQ